MNDNDFDDDDVVLSRSGSPMMLYIGLGLAVVFGGLVAFFAMSETEVEALISNAKEHAEAGRYQEATDALLTAYDLSKKTTPQEHIEVTYLLCDTYFDWAVSAEKAGQPAEASTAAAHIWRYEECESAQAKTLGMTLRLALKEAEYCSEQSDFDCAIEALERALDEEDSASTRKLLSIAHLGRGKTKLEAGDPDEAMEIFVEHNLLAEGQVAFEEAGELSRAARLAERRRSYGEASALYEEAENWRSAARAAKLNSDYARAADLYVKVGDWSSAARNYERDSQYDAAIDAWKKSGNPRRLADAYAEHAPHRLDEGVAHLIRESKRPKLAAQLYARVAFADEEDERCPGEGSYDERLPNHLAASDWKAVGDCSFFLARYRPALNMYARVPELHREMAAASALLITQDRGFAAHIDAGHHFQAAGMPLTAAAFRQAAAELALEAKHLTRAIETAQLPGVDLSGIVQRSTQLIDNTLQADLPWVAARLHREVLTTLAAKPSELGRIAPHVLAGFLGKLHTVHTRAVDAPRWNVTLSPGRDENVDPIMWVSGTLANPSAQQITRATLEISLLAKDFSTHLPPTTTDWEPHIDAVEAFNIAGPSYTQALELEGIPAGGSAPIEATILTGVPYSRVVVDVIALEREPAPQP